VELCLGLTSASRRVQAQKFNTVFVECSSDGDGLEFLQRLRREQINRTTIAVGIADDYPTLRAAFAGGANFVLSKPLSAEDAKRILRMANGVLSRMVRRFLRIAVQHLANVKLSGLDEPAFLLDLSEGGLRVQALEQLDPDCSVHFSFILPGSSEHIMGRGRVVWADASGRAGIEFIECTDADRARLKQWVVSRLRPPDNKTAATAPPRIALLQQWTSPVARAIDVGVVGLATTLFVLVISAFQQRAPALPFISATALLAATTYASTFRFLRLPFPGTRAVERLLSTPARRNLAIG
jgi:CheY-like chemotaxis protein